MTVHAAQKHMLALLSGSLRKNDLPDLIIEPTSVEDLQAALRFAAEKEIRVAVASGQHPAAVQELEGAMLVLTHKLVGPCRLSSDGKGMWFFSGNLLESMAVDLAQRGLTWPPLHPIEPGETLGTLFANAQEGLRCLRSGGVLSNLRCMEWIGYDGTIFHTGPGLSSDGVDVSPLLFGSQARYGVFTRFELAIESLPKSRTLLLAECESVEQLGELYRVWRSQSPQPSAIPFYTKTATRALRQGNDNFVTDRAVTLLAVEWDESLTLDALQNVQHTTTNEAARVNQIWQNLLRLPRTLTRLFPHRSRGRFRLPAEALVDFDERVDELARDRSLDVAVWGTLDTGDVRVWVLHPDDEARTARRAADLLERLAEDSIHLGGCPVETAAGLVSLTGFRDAVTRSIEAALVGKCDPASRFKPLRTGSQ